MPSLSIARPEPMILGGEQDGQETRAVLTPSSFSEMLKLREKRRVASGCACGRDVGNTRGLSKYTPP